MRRTIVASILVVQAQAAWAVPELERDAAAWSVTLGQNEQQLGYGLASGDVDGDGWIDVLIGAPGFGSTGTYTDEYEGTVQLYPGGPGGLSPVSTWSGAGSQRSAQLGRAVAVADVNGDGFDDVIGGTPYWSGASNSLGKLEVWLGSAQGPGPAPAWSRVGTEAGAQLGYGVARAGDVNGDGFDDVLVGAPQHDAGEASEGQALLFLGSTAGLGVAPAWMAEPDATSARFGEAVAGAGDVNGDGFDDVLIGAPGQSVSVVVPGYEGAPYLYLGGPERRLGVDVRGHAAARRRRGRGVRPAYEVAGAGDLNGDGYDDLVVGMPYDGAGGRAVVHLGGPTGPSATPDWTYTLGQGDAWFGMGVGAAGDVDGDGYDDLAIGAPQYDSGELEEGGVFLFLGSASGPGARPAWIGESDQQGPQDPEFGFTFTTGYGESVAGVDTNGDGLSDLAIGARSFTHPQTEEGAVFVHRGARP